MYARHFFGAFYHSYATVTQKNPAVQPGFFLSGKVRYCYLIELIRLWHCVTVTFSPQVAI